MVSFYGASPVDAEEEVAAVGMVYHYADALVAILSRPGDNHGCPVCRHPLWYEFRDGHADGCAWLIAARACGISD